MSFARKPPVPFGNSPAFQDAKGRWRVTVTIDNSNTIERDATDDEIAAVSAKPAPAKAEPAAAAPPAPAKKVAKKAAKKKG